MVKCRPYYVMGTPPGVHPDAASTAPLFKPGPEAASARTWTVPALCAAYDWPTGLRGDGIIAIVELGGGYKVADLLSYFEGLNQPKPSITDISVDGTKNDPGKSDDDIEVALDIEVAAASFFVATGFAATINVYWSQDIASAVAKAAADGCAVCSISWGADEAEWGKKDAEAMQAAIVKANAKGMIVFAAAGDNDSSDGGQNAANVDCPSSCPNAVACGGTSKGHTGDETVWNNNPGQTDGNGTGGGYSLDFVPMPEWQDDGGAPAGPNGTGRMVPDLAANADPNHGYEIFVQGQVQVVGGTSAVAPLMAGLFAAFDPQLGDVNPDLWAHPEAFVDIVKGNNGAYEARVGPDAVSGLGRPIGTKIAALFCQEQEEA